MRKPIFWILAGGFVLMLWAIGNSADSSTAAAADAPQTREERIAEGFSAWDGSHIELTRAIKAALNDPESYEHDETTYYDHGDKLLVTTRYRARNGFGGMIRAQAMATADLDGNIIEVLTIQ